jgi:hypothetical protein
MGDVLGVVGIPVLVITGPVGVGKTAVSIAVSDLLVEGVVRESGWL